MSSRTQRSRSERKLHDSKISAQSDSSVELQATEESLRGEMDQQASSRSSPGPSSPSEGPITYSDVVRAVQDAMRPMMEAHTAKLHQAVQDMKTQLSQLTNTVATTEHRVGEAFQDISELKSRYETLQKSHLQLSNKVDDLENRSRRCNLRIIGIPEAVKGPALFQFLQSTLPDLLSVTDECAGMVIERAHRLGPVRPEPNSRPRVVIFKTLSFVHKESLWLAYRRLKDLKWDGNRLFVFQDYSAEVTRARKEFTGLCSRLVKENKKFALLYPARLRLFDGNSFKDFSTVEDAEAYCKEKNDEELRP